jgi:GT2 family glycosyltransferase
LQGEGDLSSFKATYPELKIKAEPTGDVIVLLHENEAFRPDLLYRYEQLLSRGGPDRVFYSAAARLTKKGKLMPGGLSVSLPKLSFPYVFSACHLPGLMMPAKAWQNGVTIESLDLAGYSFVAVPLPLVSTWEDAAPLTSYEAKQLYFQKKGLNWEIQEGLLPGAIRAIPPLKEIPEIDVIIPFKEMKELTLKSAAAALASQGVNVSLTMVDNGSQDLSIKAALEAMGAYVLRVDEPFNYSRLNNLAVKQATQPKQFLCFLNNDAILDPQALEEMARWAQLKDIGMVGCRLHYPEGPLQHAGVHIFHKFPRVGSVEWAHIEAGTPFEKAQWGRLIHIPDAVTAAASMVERKKFEEVKGFDEILYPIAYSDTDLCLRLLKKGYKSLYTPYASGIHHESQSREPGFLEDFDRSQFLERTQFHG